MIEKYKGIWDIHMVSKEFQDLIKFFEKIGEKNPTRRDYAEEQTALIERATYVPYVVKYAGEKDNKEEEMVLNELAELKKEVFDILLMNGKIALLDDVIRENEYMALENLVYKAKETAI